MPVGIYVRTEEHKKNIATAIKGKHHSEETKMKISKIQKGKILSEEHKLHISQGLKGKTLGKKCSEETKHKISEVQRGRIERPEIIAKRAAAIRGYKHTDEYKKYISDNWHNHHPPESREAVRLSRIGRKHTDQTKELIRQKRLKQVFPRKVTKLEAAVRQILTLENIDFETNKDIKGQPDIFIKPDLCIFLDGCYWHGCEVCFDRNQFIQRQRMQRVNDFFVEQFLMTHGYTVLRFWEHEAKDNPERVILAINTILKVRQTA